MIDSQSAQTAGSLIGVAVLSVLTVLQGRKQGQTTIQAVDSSLAKQVEEIAGHVNALKSSLAVTQDLLSINTDKLKESNASQALLSTKYEALKATVLTGEALISQFNNYLERAKRGELIEKPIEGSGGLTAIKSKKEGS